MGLIGVKQEWPLQRLVHMLNQMQTKEKDTWKQLPLSSCTSDRDIGSNDRDQVVAWIAKQTIRFSFHPETFFLASSILDRFVTSVKAQPKYLKCIAISCLYLASKICEEEDVVPCTGELVQDSDSGCRVCDVLRMERIILEKLSWSIQCSTPLEYLHIFYMMSFIHFTDLATRLSLSRHLAVLTSHLMNAICRYEVASYPNAAISLALLSLHLESISRDSGKWTFVSRQLQSLAKVKTNDFMMCREVLKSFLSFSNLDTVVMKKVSDGESNRFTKESGIAIKRKASAPSPTTVDEWSKKPHPDIPDYPDVMEVLENAFLDSDATMTASEGEEEEAESHLAPSRPLTYADVVKSGLHSASISDRNDVSCITSSPESYASSRCSLQASYGFLSPTITTHNPVSGIRT